MSSITLPKDSIMIDEGGSCYVFDITMLHLEMSFDESIYAPYKSGVYLFPIKEIKKNSIVFWKPKIYKNDADLKVSWPDFCQYMGLKSIDHKYAVVSNPDYAKHGLYSLNFQ